MKVDPVVVWVVAVVFVACALAWGSLAVLLWVLDRIEGWISRRNARRRRWR